MYHPTVEELNKTPWEKQMAQQMTLDNSGVTLSYRNVLYIIQQHLKTLYGDMADWNKNLGIYLRSEERKHSTLFADKIENVLEITTDHLRAAMQFEEQNQRMAAKACELYQNWCNTQNVQSLALAAEILGVFPGESRISLNEYYVVFPGEKEERKKIRAQVLMDENSIGLLSMVVNLMVFVLPGWFIVYLSRCGDNDYAAERKAFLERRKRILWLFETEYLQEHRKFVPGTISDSDQNEIR